MNEKIKEKIEEILRETYMEGVNAGQVPMGVIDYSDSLEALATLLKESNEAEYKRGVDEGIKLYEEVAKSVQRFKEKFNGNAKPNDTIESRKAVWNKTTDFLIDDTTTYNEPQIFNRVVENTTEHDKKIAGELPDLLDFLSEPIKYKDVYYYLQVSKTRCWYQDLEGNGLEFKDTDGAWTDFVKSGTNLVDALGRMRNYLLTEWITPTWKKEGGFKAVLQEETYLSSKETDNGKGKME